MYVHCPHSIVVTNVVHVPQKFTYWPYTNPINLGCGMSPAVTVCKHIGSNMKYMYNMY